MVTNPAASGETFPWNTEHSKSLIQSFLNQQNMTYSPPDDILRVVPNGAAIRSHSAVAGKKTHVGRPLEFVVPDYLPKCAVLAQTLN